METYYKSIDIAPVV